MTRFLVCDTDTDYAGRVAAALHRLYEPCSVQYMYGPDALEVALRANSGAGDILLTEVELRGRNSIDIIGRHLKASSPLQVIYVTAQIEYCSQVYETRHSGFLLKPVNLDLFQKAVARAMESLRQAKATGIAVQRGGTIHVVSSVCLLYMESRGRVVRLCTDEEILESYDKLDTLTGQMDERFLQCHKSYVVNMDRVRQFRGDRFLMENGVEIPISQSRRKDVRQRFLAYLGKSPAR